MSIPQRISTRELPKGCALHVEELDVDDLSWDLSKRRPLFPFGWGLSYSKFELYGDGAIELYGDDANQYDRRHLKFPVRIKNMGPRDGADVILIYVISKFSSVKRPAKELKSFGKFHMRVGEERCIQFLLRLRNAFSFWDESQSAWKMEKGEYLVRAECSNVGSFAVASFQVKETEWWTGLNLPLTRSR